MMAASTKHVAPLVAGLWLALAGTAIAAVPQATPGAPQGNPVVPHGKPATPPKMTQPMQVLIVSDSRAGCEPNCAEWISAEGQIGPDTPAQFRRVFKVLGRKKLPIFITSPGGNVQAAFAIGREIRKRGLDVAVERTIFEKCRAAPAACDRRTLKDGEKGQPEPIGAPCASSCVFILAAGTERLVPVYGFVGVHQLVEFQTVKMVQRMYRVQRKFENWHFVETRDVISEKQVSSTTYETDPHYAPVRAYFTEMGIDTAKIMPLVLGTPHQDVHRMTPEERRATRVVTRVAAGHALLPAITAGAASAPNAAAAPAASAVAAAPPPLPGSAASVVPAVPPTLPGSAAPAVVTVKTVPVGAQAMAALSNVSGGVIVLRPPPADVLELYFRFKSASGAPLRPSQYMADIQLATGKRLTVSSTGEDTVDPLYATLTREDYCALRAAGNLSLKLALTNFNMPGWRQQLQFDATKAEGDAEFAAKHCGQVTSRAPGPTAH